MSQFTCRAAKVFLFSAASAVLMAGFASAVEENIAIGVAQTTGNGVRMREYPTTESEIVYKMDKGASVAILEEEDEGWYRVMYKGYVGYVSADYLEGVEDSAVESYAKVNEGGIYVRSGPSLAAEVLEIIDGNAYVTVTGFENGWYSVKCKYGTEGYIRSDHLDLTDNDGTTVTMKKTSSSSSSSSSTTTYSGKGSSVAAYAQRFKGYRYVYGASGPSAFDCSGFTMYVYRQFGVSLPHSASSQWTNGTGTRVYKMSNLRAGDLVFFRDPRRVQRGKACSHVGLYIGDGKFIHASSSKTGVIISSIYSGSYSKYFVGGKRIL